MTDREVPFSCDWFKVVNQDGYYYVVQNEGIAGAVIIPVVDGNLLFLAQKRHATGLQVTLEFPRGSRDGDETALECAIRELSEETCLNTSPEYFREIGEVRPDTGLLSSLVTIYKATGEWTEAEISISSESIGFRLIPLNEVRNVVKNGEITCGITLAAIALLQAQSDPLTGP